MRTIDSYWGIFKEKVLPKDIPPEVEILFKKTFYSGVKVSQDYFQKAADLPPEEGLAAVMSFDKELGDFLIEVVSSREGKKNSASLNSKPV